MDYKLIDAGGGSQVVRGGYKMLSFNLVSNTWVLEVPAVYVDIVFQNDSAEGTLMCTSHTLGTGFHKKLKAEDRLW